MASGRARLWCGPAPHLPWPDAGGLRGQL